MSPESSSDRRAREVVGGWYWQRQRGMRVALALALAFPIVAGILIVLIKLAPGWLADTHGLSTDDKSQELGRVRTAVLATMAGLIAVVGAEFTRRSYLLSRSGQVTERFSRAVEQLGHVNVGVQVGAIYALERIAKDSPDDHPAVVELLTEYVRLNAPWARQSSDPATAEQQEGFSAQDPNLRDLPVFERPADRAAIQAAMTVIGRRENRNDAGRRLELRSADLRRLDLHQASLSHAKLSRSNLALAWLSEAHLEDASISDCCLDDAALSDAHLDRARARRARFRRAWMMGAHLDYVSLVDAHLEYADLKGAHLRNADLTGAHFEMADLRGADLVGAAIDGATFDGIIWDERTRWPVAFTPPPSADASTE